jgi:ribonucleoside-diphosphate reductase alpha chain
MCCTASAARRSARARQTKARAQAPVLHVIDGGQRVAAGLARLQSLIESACAGLGADVKPEPIVAETMRNLYDGVPMDEVYKASILAARTLIEKDPDYTYATARLLLHTIVPRSAGRDVTQAEMAQRYADYFPQFIKKGVEQRAAGRTLLQFDLAAPGRRAQGRARPAVRLPRPADPVRPLLPARRKTRIELPQAFFMRVAMGLALNEIDREARAIEFYECCPASTSCPARPRCSTAARCARSCPAAT